MLSVKYYTLETIYLLFFLFLEKERENMSLSRGLGWGQRERERENLKQTLPSAEPNSGLEPMTLRS